MPSTDEVLSWRGRTVYDSSGDKVGSLEEVYLDAESGDPEWAAVKTGLIGSKLTFVPLEGVRADGDDVRVGYAGSAIKDAPSIDADGELSPEEEDRLYAHYERAGRGGGGASGDTGDVDRGVTSRSTGDADRRVGDGVGDDRVGDEIRARDDSDVGARTRRDVEEGVGAGGVADTASSGGDDAADTGGEGRLRPSGVGQSDTGIGSTPADSGRQPRIRRVITEEVAPDGNIRHRETRTEETFE